jgi:hypothetical protein
MSNNNGRNESPQPQGQSFDHSGQSNPPSLTLSALFHLNGCNDDGGHVWLADNGIAWCIHCRKRSP